MQKNRSWSQPRAPPHWLNIAVVPPGELARWNLLMISQLKDVAGVNKSQQKSPKENSFVAAAKECGLLTKKDYNKYFFKNRQVDSLRRERFSDIQSRILPFLVSC